MNGYSQRLIIERGRSHLASLQTLSLFDRSGIVISFLCLVHCAFTPVLLLLWPAVFEHTPDDDTVHIIFALLVLLSGGYAFYRGYQAHRTSRIMWMAFCGFALLLAGIFSHEASLTDGVNLGTFLTVVGSVLLITAHVKNLYTCSHACNCKDAKHT